MFDSLYEPRRTQYDIFGDSYNPPAKFEHGKWHEVVRRPKTGEDGNDCLIEELAMPARFYCIKVLNEDGSTKLELSTGSGDSMAQLVKDMADAFCEGMLGLHESEVQA